MCLTTTNPAIYVAEEDIYVYKKLDKFPVSRKNRTISEILLWRNRFCYKAAAIGYKYKRLGVNPYVPLRVVPRYDNNYVVHEGYHSDVLAQRDSNALFMIPAGTKFIRGWYNSDSFRINYVSETIIFVKSLSRKEVEKLVRNQ